MYCEVGPCYAWPHAQQKTMAPIIALPPQPLSASYQVIIMIGKNMKHQQYAITWKMVDCIKKQGISLEPRLMLTPSFMMRSSGTPSLSMWRQAPYNLPWIHVPMNCSPSFASFKLPGPCLTPYSNVPSKENPSDRLSFPLPCLKPFYHSPV